MRGQCCSVEPVTPAAAALTGIHYLITAIRKIRNVSLCNSVGNVLGVTPSSDPILCYTPRLSQRYLKNAGSSDEHMEGAICGSSELSHEALLWLPSD